MPSKPNAQYLHEMSWEEKAKENPLYGVMSHESFATSGQPTEEELAMFYERGHFLVDKWIVPWLSETLAEPDADVLEFGCGMGRITQSLSRHHDPAHILGVDISPTMIELAREHTDPAIRYDVVGEDGALPYADASIDRVYSYAVFQHIKQKSTIARAIAEIGRVLKPGGYARLNFDMMTSPDWSGRSSEGVFGFEDSYLMYGWKKLGPLRLWGARRIRSNHWSGTRLSYGQLVKELEAAGMWVYGMKQEPNLQAIKSRRGMMWVYARKEA